MKQQVVIENPVINSPFEEPERHFGFDDDGITEEIIPGRRESGYFIPIPTPRALRAEIDEEAWSTLYSTTSCPFPRPETGKIAVKVINHYGDEVMRVCEVG